MTTEYSIFNSTRPSIEQAGKWIATFRTNSGDIDVPALAAWSDVAYTDFALHGYKGELGTELTSWIGSQMDRPFDNARLVGVHSAFRKLFPVESLPDNVAPNWIQPKILEFPKIGESVVIQPLTLTSVPTSEALSETKIFSRPTVREVDPFLIARITKSNPQGNLSHLELGHTKVFLGSFWKNLTKAAEYSKTASVFVSQKTSRESAIAAQNLIEQASDNLKGLIGSVAMYLQSLEYTQPDFPLSPSARGFVLFPWAKKAVDAWMEPISTLARAGRLELPGVSSK